jgi:hypothetical protein
MIQGRRRIDPFAGINRQTLGDQILGPTGNIPPKLGSKIVLSIARSIKDFVFVFIIKGKVTSQQQKQNDTDTPNVAFDVVTRPPF